MRAFRFISLVVLAALAVACERTYVGDASEPQMGIAIEMPGPLATRADVGEVPPISEDEYKLHTLKVWAFTSEGHERIAYLNLAASQFPAPGRTRNYSVPVTRSFAKANPRPDVDIFVIANEAAIGITNLNRDTDWQTLRDATFGDPYFGISPLVRIPSDETGLPMSAMGLNMPVLGDDPVLKLNPVKLTRMVSKVRFVFCRMENEQENDILAVSSISIEGDKIPVTERVFTQNKYDIVTDDGYLSSPITIDGPATLARNATPEKLTYAGQDAMSYENLINDAVEAGILSDAGTLYLRESNKLIKGSVVYSINGEEDTKTFSMDRAGDFARNHSWLVYGYFLSGRNLQLSVNVLPWDYNIYDVSFEENLKAGQFQVDATTVDETEPVHNQFHEQLRSGVTAKGHLNITAPVGGKLYIQPIGDAYAFEVKPDVWDINPKLDGGNVEISIQRNPNAEGDLTGKYITLSFAVEVGERWIDANSEILPENKEFRFIL